MFKARSAWGGTWRLSLATLPRTVGRRQDSIGTPIPRERGAIKNDRILIVIGKWTCGESFSRTFFDVFQGRAGAGFQPEAYKFWYYLHCGITYMYRIKRTQIISLLSNLFRYELIPQIAEKKEESLNAGNNNFKALFFKKMTFSPVIRCPPRIEDVLLLRLLRIHMVQNFPKKKQKYLKEKKLVLPGSFWRQLSSCYCC